MASDGRTPNEVFDGAPPRESAAVHRVPWGLRDPNAEQLRKEAGRLQRFLAGGAAAEELVAIPAGASGDDEAARVDGEVVAYGGAGPRPNNVRNLRRAAGMNLSELASAANLPADYLDEVEREPREGSTVDGRNPDPSARRQIAAALGRPEAEVFPWRG